MLLNITVENFRSYNEPQTLSLIASDDSEINAVNVGDVMVRKAAVIYGANASGKSNLIKALITLIDILRFDLNQPTEQHRAPVYTPFFKNHNPTSISIDFSIDDKIYTYTLSYDDKKIHTEKLLYEDDTPIFIRHFVDGSYEYLISKPELILSSEQLKVADGLLKQIQLSTSERRLFLRQLVENNCKKLEPILHGIIQIVIRLNPYGVIGKPLFAEQDLSYAANYFKDKNQDEMVIKPLNSIGVNLEGLKVVFNSENPRPGDVFHGVRQLLSKYNINGNEYELNFLTDESDGTIKFYTYLALVDHIIQTNGLLVIDEVETHFHPLLVEEIIRAVQNSNSKAQIIFTTHNPILLNNSIFEPDQVYFATKNEEKHATELYSLADFDDLEDNDNWVAKYLTGNFGAIPYLRGLFFGKDKSNG